MCHFEIVERKWFANLNQMAKVRNHHLAIYAHRLKKGLENFTICTSGDNYISTIRFGGVHVVRTGANRINNRSTLHISIKDPLYQ